MKCTFSPQARDDLTGIGDYIAENNPARAVTFVQELRAYCANLAEYPSSARRRPELGQELRIAPYGNYLVCYETIGDGIHIIRIVSGKRYLPALFDM